MLLFCGVFSAFKHFKLSNDRTGTRHNTTPSQSCTCELINPSVSEGEGAEAMGRLIADAAAPICRHPPSRCRATARADPRCPTRTANAERQGQTTEKNKGLSRSHRQSRKAAACRGSATSPGALGGCCGTRRTFAPRQCSDPPRSGRPDGGPARGKFTFTCWALTGDPGAEQQQQQQAPQAPPGEGGRHGAPRRSPRLSPDPHPAGCAT